MASVPPDTLRSPLAASWLRRVRVPPMSVNAANEAVAPIARVPVPEKLTEELVAVNVVTEEVSQLPVDIVMTADANVMVAGPFEVRLLAPNATVAPVRVNVPLQVSEPVKVVEIAGLTVRLFTPCGTLTVPPEAFTMKVEVPAVSPPRCVSMDVIVIVDPLAVSAPPATTSRVTALTGTFEPLVSNVVVPVPPPMVRVPATLSPRVARVNATADEPELKVTLANSLPARFDPAKVIVCAEDALKIKVAVPAFHDAEVLPLSQDPETDQVSEPNAMYEAAADMVTLPEIAALPEVEVSAPPDRVRVPTESVAVDLAKVPPETVNALTAVMAEPAATVPEVTVRL